MSLNKSNTRRLSLLAGSSLIAAGLICVGALVGSPTAAVAAPNPCGTDPNTNLGAPDSITCPAGAYPTGIQHTSNGDLTVSIAKGANLGTGGSLTEAGQLADDVAVVVTGTGNWSGNGMASPVMFDLESQQGNINFDMATGTLQANNATTTHAVRAISQQGGDVTVTLGAGGATAAGTASQAGIEARSYGGGDVTVNVVGNVTQSRLYGILASTDGAGALTINGGASISSSATAPVAAIHATTGTGLLTINGVGSGRAGTGVFMDAGGDVLFTGGGTSDSQYGIDLYNDAGTASTLNLTSNTRGALAAIRAQGAGNVTVNVSAQMDGAVDFSGLTTTASMNVLDGGVWTIAESATTGGAIILTTEGTGTIRLGEATAIPDGPSYIPTFNPDEDFTLIFAGPADELDHGGRLFVGPNTFNTDDDDFESNTTLAGLETFRNSGMIIFGGGISAGPTTDGWYDDILNLPGTNYIGEGGVLLIDANLSAGPQAGCSDGLRDPATGLLPAADCLTIAGGTTSGVTYIRLNDRFAADRGGYNPEGVVLVDVTGGESAQGHFLIDPASVNYSAENGGVIDKGFFFYPLIYDEENQQHKLITVPGANAMQFPIIAQAAQALWRTSTGTWLDRQADLRGNFDEGVGGGVWLRTSVEFANRDTLQSTTAVGTTYQFANAYDQNSYAVTGGIDLLSGSSRDSAYVVGLMAGYARATLASEIDDNYTEMNGWTGGAYASFISGGLFVDAAVNANKVMVDSEVPELNLFPEGSLLRTDILSVGAQVEAGWRFPLTEAAFVEPLANVSYVRTSSDVLDIRSADASAPKIGIDFDDPTSFRAALGARMGVEKDYGPVAVQYSFLARLWNEFEDETAVNVLSTGPTTQVIDAFSGQFSEFAVGASLYGLNDALSGFFNFGGKFGDDYKSQNMSAGVRVNW